MKSMQVACRMFLLSALVLVLSCSGSGTGGSGGLAGVKIRLSGTIVADAPIVNTTMAVRDSTGKIVTLTTGPTGTFDAALGMMLPVILRAPDPSTGKFLYSYASAEGTVNIHPLTDPILRIWFKAKGPSGNIDNDFLSSTPYPYPTISEIEFIKAILTTIIRDLLSAVGVSWDSFDLITSSFNSNGTGFDRVLKGIRINANDTGTVNILVKPGSTLETDVKNGGFSLSAYLNSSIISLATDTTPPAAPSGLAATPLCGAKALVTWSTSTSTDVASYEVYEQTDGYVATVTYSAYVHPKPLSRMTFTYSVRAVDAAGNASPFSNTGTADFTGIACSGFGTPPPLSSAPSLSALSSSQLLLDWSSIPESGVGNLLEFRVYSVGTATTLIGTTDAQIGVLGRKFTDFQLDPGTQYCYSVVLVSLAGAPPESAPSPVACASTLPGIPHAPRNVLATAGSGTISVSWDPVGGAWFYNLYTASAPGITRMNYATLTEGTLHQVLTGTSHLVTGLTAGKTYYAVVTAVSPSGESAESVQVQATP